MQLPEPAVIAAFLSAVAATAAAVATWRGPMIAARLAEALRRDGEAAHEQRRMKLYIFTTLMQERAQLYSLEGVRALNLIDVVYNKSAAVREAWANLYLAFDPAQKVPSHAQNERLNTLLKEMAADIGLSNGLRLDDFGRVYYPTALAEEQRLQELERKQALARIQGNTPPSANTAASPPSLYPPKPE